VVGETVAHSRTLEKLGGDGMGVVHKAEDTKLERFVPSVSLRWQRAEFLVNQPKDPIGC